MGIWGKHRVNVLSPGLFARREHYVWNLVYPEPSFEKPVVSVHKLSQDELIKLVVLVCLKNGIYSLNSLTQSSLQTPKC